MIIKLACWKLTKAKTTRDPWCHYILRWEWESARMDLENFVELFLGGPNWFSELSQTTIKTLIRPNFLRRRQSFEKRPKKAFIDTFWKNSTKKLRFFGARSLLKIRIDWCQGRLQKNFKVSQPKMDISK